MTYDVCIIKGKDPYKTTKLLLKKLNFHLNGKKVLIKPNLVSVASSETGITTDVNIVRAILEELKDCNVIIGEGSAGNTKKAFEVNGYYDLAENFDIELIDFNEDTIVWKKIPKPFQYKKLPFAKTALQCDYLIDVSKLKIHAHATVTLSLKNLFGTIPKRRNKIIIHPFIRRAICDIAQIIKPDLNIIDGIIGNECDEVISHPVNSGIIIGGYDALSVDLIGCKCMGINPQEVEYLQLAQELFGPRNIKLIGEKIEDVKINFKRERLAKTDIRYLKEKIANYALRITGPRM